MELYVAELFPGNNASAFNSHRSFSDFPSRRLSIHVSPPGNILPIEQHYSIRGDLPFEGAHHPGLPYDATKGALDAMTRVMGIELAELGIRVNGIAPGAIYTEHRLPIDHPKMKPYAQLIPIRRLGIPLEIGAVVAFLASDDASYIIGQTIYVDGGITSQLSPSQYQI
jgi:NAD(P)-dependent dehydrogenase (short-subunit alcohol dehydrogenase family)